MSRIKGFALIELMIAMVLGLVILGGVGSVFVASRQAFRTNENLARVQENARTAFELMAREVRGAGGSPCGTPWVANVLSNPTATWWKDWAAGSLIGYDGALTPPAKAFGTGTAERVAGTDAILIKSGTLQSPFMIVSHDAAAARFTLNGTDNSIEPGDVVMGCDYRSAAIFQVTAWNQGAKTIDHAVGGTSLNCSIQLGVPGNDCGTRSSKTFLGGGFVAPYSALFWYVGNNDRGGRSLYRMDTASTTEIADGVTDMQIEYLTRTVASGSLASSYLAAGSIAGWTDGAANRVVAVRISIDLESGEIVGTDQAPLARQIIHVVSLRNRESVR